MNELQYATSPYLRQHADNPVNWVPWGDSAFAEARERDVPIFLSVGYATCHWCHVMAHESFEDAATAQVLNANFVCVKVDREERPDVDAVYMAALQAFSGHGGWPMSVFLDHDRAPFYAGTYWPKTPRHGAPTFLTVLDAICDAWVNRRDDVKETVQAIRQALTEAEGPSTQSDMIDVSVADAAAELLVERAYDRVYGGFGRAPKFPYAMTLEWLLHYASRTGRDEVHLAATNSLDAMARGGIYDLVCDGFARYATDERWLIPHFEKMLYDNALLLVAYVTAYRDTGQDVFLRTANGVARWLISMQQESGGFNSAVDADSEGHEGRFAVFLFHEFVAVVASTGENAELFATFFGVSEAGNFDGVNVLSEPVDRRQFAAQHDLDAEVFAARIDTVIAALSKAREARIQPIVDDKLLTDLNALTIRGLIIAGTALDEPAYLLAARKAGTFLTENHLTAGMLYHTSKDGMLGPRAFAADYAAYALSQLYLFSLDGDASAFARAIAAATTVKEHFADPVNGGYFTTADDGEALLVRPKDMWDNATPSASSIMVEVCLLIADLTGDASWRSEAETVIRAFQPRVQQNPSGYGWLLRQYETLTAGLRVCVIVGDDTPERAALARVAHAAYSPSLFTVVAAEPDQTIGVFTGRTNTGTPTAYVCKDLVCARPVTDADALRALLSNDV
ncbi:MAG: thioredoxin domain-containing protein [Nitriliruptoraceae bacterium]